MAGEDNKNKRRNLGTGNSAGGGGSESSSSRELPDELVVEILSRLGSLNEVVRCSSLVCKQWRNLWRLTGGRVLDFDKCDELSNRRSELSVTPEEKRRFANRVDQALRCFAHHHQNLDALKIGFDLYGIEEDAIRRWIEFGLTKRVKELALSSVLLFYPLSLRPFTEHDLGGLEVLEFYGLKGVSQAVFDHILSNCPSLRRLVLRSCSFQRIKGRQAVLRVCSGNINLQHLYLDDIFHVDRIELISAPRLGTLKLRRCHSIGFVHSWVIFGDDLPQLREVQLHEQGILPQQFSRIAPRLERLGLEVAYYDDIHLDHYLAPDRLSFEKLGVLDLFLYLERAPPSFLECTGLLRAAPMLHTLSIWFKHFRNGPTGWKRQDLAALSTWKHPFLRVLRLYGVRRTGRAGGAVADARKRQLELAAYVIMNAPYLSQVIIHTRCSRDPTGDYHHGQIRLSGQIDAQVREVKMELETQLQGHSVSSQINFTYQ